MVIKPGWWPSVGKKLARWRNCYLLKSLRESRSLQRFTNACAWSSGRIQSPGPGCCYEYSPFACCILVFIPHAMHDFVTNQNAIREYSWFDNAIFFLNYRYQHQGITTSRLYIVNLYIVKYHKNFAPSTS